MVSRTSYFKGNRCAHCGGIRSDSSTLWCANCVGKYGNSDHTHVNQFFNKSSEWKTDNLGCMVRYHGDIDETQRELLMQ